jgi:hypothetical protein
MDKLSCICITMAVISFVIVTILLLSMDSIEPLEYGITYNKFTKTAGTKVFDSGRYIIGPWYSFITYPANLVTIEFSDSRKAIVLIIKLE